MRWAILVLAVSLLVGWTSAAAAECAWVLWSKSQSLTTDPRRTTTQLEIYSAYANANGCENARDAEWKRTLETYMGLHKMGMYEYITGEERDKLVMGYRGEKDLDTVRYLCLPDTIDPRDKKE